MCAPDLPNARLLLPQPGLPTPGSPSKIRPHIALAIGTGILTCFPSATHLCLALGADSPCADERCAGNLGLSARELFTPFIATHVSIRTSDTSSSLHEPPSTAYRTLSYRQRTDDKRLKTDSHLSRFSPTCCGAHSTSGQSCGSFGPRRPIDLRRCSLGPGCTAPRHAFHPLNPSQSARVS